MGLFDFLKKKELKEIQELKSDLASCNQSRSQKEKDLEKYSSIINLEEEKKSIISEIAQQKTELIKLNEKYLEGITTYKNLKNDISIFENNLELSEFGVYEPIYDFEKSDDYRIEQNKIIELQKSMIKEATAAICRTNWTVDGSLSKGKASTTRFIKLILRAFNGEADSLIAKVKWNNVNQIKERLKKAFETLNKLGESQTVEITHKYFKLKMQELILEYEYRAKKQQEKEELRALQEELREEEKAKREFEKAQKEAEKEEAYYLKILEKVKKDFAEKNGNPEELQNKISELEKELEEAQLKKERALSMAQQTKRGHVYIISNIGSFGENVFKIGMTRRLEPMDRIRELGDASVPFRFDVHALIYSDEARTLEYELHKAFSEKALNLFNFRKEFFNVTLEEIEDKIKELGFSAEFTSEPEAMEYKETLAIKNKENIEVTERETLESEFPQSLI
ncbi:T5orf172 domain-containing protein [Chryseobacterium taichungense]|uniref:T5orf172 domain-containing protein n=1 Tax=Chryseobacterium taichungense TaxID=295069 RepID=A0A1H7Y1I8_9FLAO|nr:DUF4041 domain-containing protein [Chryseobacterium taichungense]SEM40066.1 T5orf172 domain-containing protein [Chryseobacterium taichungense]